MGSANDWSASMSALCVRPLGTWNSGYDIDTQPRPKNSHQVYKYEAESEETI